MNHSYYYMKTEILKNLINIESVGEPLILSSILHVSKRTLQRMIFDLKQNGNNVKYNRQEGTYFII